MQTKKAMKNIKGYTQALNEALGQEELNIRLERAVWDGNLHSVKSLIGLGADPKNASGSDGSTPLHLAADRGREDIVGLLLDRGADPNARNRDGSTPLHYAALNDHAGPVGLLLDRGADPNARNNFNRTPLYYAVVHRKAHTARLLILRGADPLEGFKGPLEILDLFKGDIDWIPDGPLRTKLQRMQRGKQAFGM